MAAGVDFDDAVAQRKSRGQIMLTDILSTLYVAAGVIGNVAYVPTIRDLWQLKPAANLYSYMLWSGTSAVVFAYAAAVNCDRLFVALSALTLVLCVGVVLLEFRRKRIVACGREETAAVSGD